MNEGSPEYQVENSSKFNDLLDRVAGKGTVEGRVLWFESEGRKNGLSSELVFVYSFGNKVFIRSECSYTPIHGFFEPRVHPHVHTDTSPYLSVSTNSFAHLQRAFRGNPLLRDIETRLEGDGEERGRRGERRRTLRTEESQTVYEEGSRRTRPKTEERNPPHPLPTGTRVC